MTEAEKLDRLRHVFDSFDSNGNGKLEVPEIKAALAEVGLPNGQNYIRELLQQYDKDGDGEIDFSEFSRYVGTKVASVRRAFESMDTDGNGQLDAEEVRRAVLALGLSVSLPEAERMVALLDRDGDARIDFEEFGRFVVLLPGSQARAAGITSAWLDSADWVESMEYRLSHVPPSEPLERFLAGGVAGAASRTVVAPLERLRTLMMTSAGAAGPGTSAAGAPHTAAGAGQGLGAGAGARPRASAGPGPVRGGVAGAPGLRATLQRMWAEGGVRGLFTGNLATVIKVFPSSAIQFAVYDTLKEVMLSQESDKGVDLSSLQKFGAGFVSGAAACTVTYPLEALRTQIQVAKGVQGSYMGIVRGLVAANGVRGLYQGFAAGLTNNSLCMALGFASYEGACTLYRRYLNDGAAPSTNMRGVLGGVGALVTMTATMPMENVVRRLQVQGRPGYPVRYKGLGDCVLSMLRQEGVSTFWRGSVSTYLKVVPSIAATRLLYEGIVAYRGIGGVRRYRMASEQGEG